MGRRQPRHSRRPLRRLVAWSLTLAIWAGLGVAALGVYYAHDLPNVRDAVAETRDPSVTFLARDGTRLTTYGDSYGGRLRLDALPAHVSRAVLAAEDRQFYHHPGVDPLGLVRAAWANLRAWDIRQGGSTLTQQLAKNLFLSPAQTLKRKAQELLLALWLEHEFSKDTILEIYLNRVYLGQGAYGVDAAARTYFGKPPTELTRYEAAMLAGMLSAPAARNPHQHPEAAHEAAVRVLDDMAEAGFISRATARRAAERRDRGHAEPTAGVRYFTDWAMERVRDRVGTPRRDLVVRTTLDPALQRTAQAALQRKLRREGAAKDAGQGAIVTLARNGAVRTLVGGRSYARSPFNRATQAKRQPGSAFKPFVYLAAMEDGMTPDTRLRDEPVTVDGWSPSNFTERHRGEVTLREAFARSLNAVAVKLQQRVGGRAVVNAARRLGITTPLDPHPSLALGTSEVRLLDLAGAYAVFANGGRNAFPHAITRIRTRGGETIHERGEQARGRLIGRDALARMTDLFHADIAWGTGQAAALGRPAGGKTGTSQRARDAWFLGFTARLVTGVWLGNDDGSPMDGVTGGGMPAELWATVMREALDGTPERPLAGQRIARNRDTTAETDPDTDGGTARDGGDVISRIIESLPAGESPDDGDSPAAVEGPGRP